MKHPLIFSAFVLGTALAIGCAWSARRAERAHAQRAASAESIGIGLQRVTQAAHERLSMLEHQHRAAQEAREKTAKAASAEAARPAPSLNRLATDPELQNLQLAARRAQLALTYGPFYRSQRLTTAQRDAVEANLIKREENLGDIWAMLNQQNLAPSDPAVRELYTRVLNEHGAAQASTLGANGALALAEYERVGVAREVVAGMAAAAVAAGVPLDAGQVSALTDTLTKASREYHAGRAVTPGTIDWAEVHAAASAFLTPAQLTFIETTEAQGLRGGGARFLGAIHAAVDAAVQQETAPAR